MFRGAGAEEEQMLGIIVGTLCLVGFIAVWRRRFGRGCYPGHGFGRGGFFGRRRHFGMYRLFEELDTSPGQEKAIRGAINELRGTLGGLRPSLVEARSGVAAAIASETFDGAAVEQNLDTRVGELSRVGPSLALAIGKIHEALDADQRRRLARFIDSLPYGPAF
jgi:Spy/CpxP family protein refolding chaperone